MKITQIKFGNPPFRMLKNLEISIASRITVIAGHNGIGKSTILGLIANGSEIKKNQGTTLFNLAFQAQFHELFYLDEKDYITDRTTKPSFELVYSQEGLEDMVKTCNVSQHTEKEVSGSKVIIKKRLKIVPRGQQEGWEVGPSAKVNIPTLYLSMSRMLPIGDQQSSLSASVVNRMSDEDKIYIEDKFKRIIDHKIVNSGSVTKHELRGTTKRSLVPEFEHSTKTISLGQDSLSSIITAFASFNKLKREHPTEYKGGILLIDEIDAGFHPRAQVKLVKLIKEEAKSLQLQVIITSHSLTVIQEVFKISDTTARSGRNIDTVVYIQDVLRPSLMSEPTYPKVKDDMLSRLPAPEAELPKIKIYFEDEEAKWFFEQIIKFEQIDLKKEYNYDFILVAAKLGCSNLKALFNVDDYFKTVIIIFDNDVLSKSTDRLLVEANSNLIVLPAQIETESCLASERTPEFQIYKLISKLLEDVENAIWSSLPQGYNLESIKDNFIDPFPMNSGEDQKLRELRKDWFKRGKIHFEQLELIKYFCSQNQVLVNHFISDLKNIISELIENKKHNV